LFEEISLQGIGFRARINVSGAGRLIGIKIAKTDALMCVEAFGTSVKLTESGHYHPDHLIWIKVKKTY
jgi:hypothetical protein